MSKALSVPKLYAELVQAPHAQLITSLAAVSVSDLSGVPRYIREVCGLISDNVEAYRLLRDVNKLTPSRVLIRPCAEAAMKLAAVVQNPNNLLNIAYTEAESDRLLLEQHKKLMEKWHSEGRPGIGPESVERAKKGLADREALWKKSRAQLGPLFPTAPAKDTYLKPWMLAEAGNQGELYGTDYAMYCNFTHSSMRAVNSWPEMMLGLDTLAVGKCLRIALLSLEQIGGPKVPDDMRTKLQGLVGPAKAGNVF